MGIILTYNFVSPHLYATLPMNEDEKYPVLLAIQIQQVVLYSMECLSHDNAANIYKNTKEAKEGENK